MRIEMVTAEAVKFLPVIFSNETTAVAENNEPVQQTDENVEGMTESCATSEVSSESTTTSEEVTAKPEEKEESFAVINPNEMDTKCNEASVQPEDENTEIDDENSITSETSSQFIDDGKEETETATESVSEEKDENDSETQVEIIADNDSCVEVVDSEGSVLEEDTEFSISSIYKEDKYEEEYGEMVAHRIQKMSSPKKKNTLKTANSEKKKKPAVARNSEGSTIHNHFESNGFVVIEYSKLPEISGLKELTSLIGDNYKYTAQFLKAARQAACAPNSKGERVMRFTFNNEAGGFFHTFLNTLKKYGLLTKYFINGNLVTATISPVPKVLSYLTGQWLEVYASQVLESTISDYAHQHNVDYDIFMNVKVASITSVNKYAHEVDCVISIADKCFAFEAKSGAFDDYSMLYNTRKELKFVPDHYLLLSTSIEDIEVAQTLQYFYEFFITGIETFRERLLTMINKAFA
ncbi:MAG: hypothetical protein K5979_00195 [Ruminococcus sp.]|nr:hypothetical protein [Ruminococcus sp.]